MDVKTYEKATDLIEKITDAETALNDLEIIVGRGDSLGAIKFYNGRNEDGIYLANMGFDESIFMFVQGLLEKRLQKLTEEFESL
jgi:hypothetical protein